MRYYSEVEDWGSRLLQTCLWRHNAAIRSMRRCRQGWRTPPDKALLRGTSSNRVSAARPSLSQCRHVVPPACRCSRSPHHAQPRITRTSGTY